MNERFISVGISGVSKESLWLQKYIPLNVNMR